MSNLVTSDLKLAHVSKNAGADEKAGLETKKVHLAALSVLGFEMFVTLIGLVCWRDSGLALLVAIKLSSCLSTIDVAPWWELDLPDERPKGGQVDVLATGDMAIFYPKTDACRVVWCDDSASRCISRLSDTSTDLMIWSICLMVSLIMILLMGGSIILGNSAAELRTTSATCYILLNGLYWLLSALDLFTHVRKHKHNIKKFKISFQADSDRVIPEVFVLPRLYR